MRNRMKLHLFLSLIILILVFINHSYSDLSKVNLVSAEEDAGDGHNPRLELNDNIDFAAVASLSQSKNEWNDIVLARESFNDYKDVNSIVYFPFATIDDMAHHAINRLPKNWIIEMLAHANVSFVVLQNERDNVDNEAVKSKLQAVSSKMAQAHGFSSLQISFKVCTLPFDIEQRHNWFMVLLAILFCVDGKHQGPFSVLAPSTYADPYDLQSVMDAIVVSEYTPVIVMENEMVVTSGEIMRAFAPTLQDMLINNRLRNELNRKATTNEGLLKALNDLLTADFSVSPLNQAMNLMLIKPVRDEKIVYGDYSSYPLAKQMMEQHQLLRNRNLLQSCSMPRHEEFSFHQVYTATFKSCSFVANIKRDYEYHAIRYLQRLARGKQHEVDWQDPQTGKDGKKCDVAVGITIRVTHIWERMMIRQLWAPLLRSLGTVRLFFVYGQLKSEIPETTKQQLELESKYFKDIAYLPSTEGYFLMFQKVTSYFGWVVENTNCEVVMKMDPDSYPRIFPVMKFLYKHRILPPPRDPIRDGIPHGGVYFGMIYVGAKSIKDANHRWYFYDKWPYETLPNFMSGAFFGLTRNLAQYIYQHREPDMRLDDPGIGAILTRLREKSPDAVRYESPPEFTIFRTDRFCRQDRYFDNPVFNDDFNMDKEFNEDLFGASFCHFLRKSYVPLAELSTIDNLFEPRTFRRIDGGKIASNSVQIPKPSNAEIVVHQNEIRNPITSIDISVKGNKVPPVSIKLLRVVEERNGTSLVNNLEIVTQQKEMKLKEIKESKSEGYMSIIFSVPWIAVFVVSLTLLVRRRKLQRKQAEENE